MPWRLTLMRLVVELPNRMPENPTLASVLIDAGNNKKKNNYFLRFRED